MISVNIYEAKTRLSALIGEVENKGESVLICRNGKPVAELRAAVSVPDPFACDPALKVTFHKSPALPLDPEDWPEAFA
jgi:antitoxin (DNA-binding transcriptional repressor) of toxin-antitoxin stability system